MSAPVSPSSWAREECAREGVLAPSTKHVLMLLASYCTTDDWQVQVPLSRLVLLTGRDDQTVIASLHALRKRNLIRRRHNTRTRRAGTAEIYELRPGGQQ